MIDKKDFVVLNGNCIDVLKTLEDNSVDCCITSPPYYGLRDYGTGKWVGGDPNCNHARDNKVGTKCITGHSKMEDKENFVGDAIYKTVCKKCGAVRIDEQIGLEETPEQYVEKLVQVFREVKRVLKDTGTLWVNIGDTYNVQSYKKDGNHVGNGKQLTNVGSFINAVERKTDANCKPKDLIGIPWMLAFALRKDGWYLRQDIIWEKPNPMPEPKRGRFTKSHEYIFLLSKKSKYYFDQESAMEVATGYDGRKDITMKGSAKYEVGTYGQGENSFASRAHKRWEFNDDEIPMRHKHDVWNIPVGNYEGAHFATYPVELVENCLLCGCPVGGTVLDPFSGSGTTGICAVANGRKYVGIELNKEYVELSNQRFDETFYRKVCPKIQSDCTDFKKFDFGDIV